MKKMIVNHGRWLFYCVVLFVINFLNGCAPNDAAKDELNTEFDVRLIGRWETKDLGSMPDSIYRAGRDDLGKAEIVFCKDSTYKIKSDFSWDGDTSNIAQLDDRGNVLTKNNGMALIGNDAWIMKRHENGELYLIGPEYINTYFLSFSWKNYQRIWKIYKFNPDSIFTKNKSDTLKKVINKYSGNDSLLNNRRLFNYAVAGDTLKTWSEGRLIIWKRKNF
jgi:hypothetical protein